jgi:hypothetical protein
MVGRIEGPAAPVVDDGANGNARHAQYFWKFLASRANGHRTAGAGERSRRYVHAPHDRA